MMKVNRAVFRFYGELNDFLEPERRGRAFEHEFKGHPAVKDRIETLGVPHTEVQMVLVGGRPVSFFYQVREGDRVSVYPCFRRLDLPGEMLVRRVYPGCHAFVLDIHLGQLARYLRMLGFDALYRNDYRDSELAEISASRGRILLTRDRGLLKRKEVVYGYLVREDEPEEQLVEVLRRYGLYDLGRTFGRCLECNGELVIVPREEVLDGLQRRTKKYYERFFRCTDCGRVYWRGSHYNRMKDFIAGIRARLEPLIEGEKEGEAKGGGRGEGYT